MGITLDQWRASVGGWNRRAILLASANSKDSSASPWFLLLVVMALLIIGGVELNPGPDEVAQLYYKKREGVADMSGGLYKIKMATLLFLRGLNSNHVFRIASNVAAAGSSNDLVFTVGHRTSFLQLKHKQRKDAKLYTSQLLTVKGDFSVLKHCKTYLDIKRQWQHDKDLQCCGKFEDSLFVVFTNATLAGNIESNVGSSVMHELLNVQGRLIQFTEQQYGVFDSLESHKQLLLEAVNSEQVPDTPELLQVVKELTNYKGNCVPEKKALSKLLTDLESLGDLSGYKEFLSRLWFFTEQAQENMLDDVIRTELSTLFGNDKNFFDLKIGVENWWRKFNVYLTDQTKFFQNILQKIASNITKDISALKIKFGENECDSVKKMLTSDSRMLYIHTENINLSSLKVLQSFQTNLLIDVKTLQTHLNEVLAVWRLGVCDVLVVEGAITDNNVLHKLFSMPFSKNVVVISDSKPTHLYQKFVSFTDTFSLSQLDSDSQRAILEHEVIFQGVPVKLNSLADVSFLESAITADVVTQLDHTLKIGHRLDDLDPCYIPRKFQRKEFVSKEIFKENIVLAVSGISADRLAKQLPQGEKLCKSFHIGGESEFTNLCRDNENIHWIEACEESFIWKKSKGDISLVLDHLEKKCATYVGVEEVIALPHQLVLVVAEPGMGKTTEMCNIAHTLKEKDSSTWVIPVNLNQHIDENPADALAFLERVATLSTDFQKHLFEHQLQSSGNVVILLDGFDEISPIYSEKVFSLLRKFLKTRSKIFITSCPVTLVQLQQELSTLEFSLEPFTSKDQENFLATYWNQESFKLSKFISTLLQLVGASVNDKWKEFTGIPLQTRMLAEVFQEDALHYCQTDEIRLPQSLDVLQLYDKFVDKKWEMYCRKLGINMNDGLVLSKFDLEKQQFQQSLMNCAMFSYLDDKYIRRLKSACNVFEQNESFIKQFKSGCDKTGIVIDIINGKALFVHRTFTEYFVAKWHWKHFDSELQSVKKIYFDKNFEIIQKFLDRMLAQNFKLHTAVLNEDLSNVKVFLSEENSNVDEEDEGGRTALHLAITNYYYYSEGNVDDDVLETLLKYGANINYEDRVLNYKPLRLAEMIRAWSVVDILLEQKADGKDLVWIKENIREKIPQQEVGRSGDFVQSGNDVSMEYRMSRSLQDIMHLALKNGYANLVKFILECGVSLEQTYQYGNPVLHTAIKHPKLVQFLIEKGADVHITGGVYERTPLMEAAEGGLVHVVEVLIRHKASVNARDRLGDTALILAAHKGEYEVVDLLLQNGADVDICNNYDRTALIWAAYGGYAQVAKLLISQGASINVKDSSEETALSYAAANGEYEVVELLLRSGADIDVSCNDINRTPLMHSAVFGHVQIAELLINHGLDVNAKDDCGDTALSLAVKKGKYDVVNLLLQKEADIELCVVYDRTPLMQAALCGHVQVVVLLTNNKASINARDKGGYTSLSLAASKGNYEVVELLLQKGADTEVCDVYNRTPLMQATIQGHVKVVELLINHKASINARDKHGDTALSLAALNGKYKVIKLLLEDVDNIELSGGSFNRTPLMQAAVFGHVQVVELLIEHQIDVNAKDDYGDTALSLTSTTQHNNVRQLLIKHGAQFH